jgi:hypothetical protein
MLQVDMAEVFEKIKDILSSELKNDRLVFDKDIARELNIKPSYLGTIKARKTIPHEELFEFCARRKISINWLLFSQDASESRGIFASTQNNRKESATLKTIPFKGQTTILDFL